MSKKCFLKCDIKPTGAHVVPLGHILGLSRRDLNSNMWISNNLTVAAGSFRELRRILDLRQRRVNFIRETHSERWWRSLLLAFLFDEEANINVGKQSPIRDQNGAAQVNCPVRFHWFVSLVPLSFPVPDTSNLKKNVRDPHSPTKSINFIDNFTVSKPADFGGFVHPYSVFGIAARGGSRALSLATDGRFGDIEHRR